MWYNLNAFQMYLSLMLHSFMFITFICTNIVDHSIRLHGMAKSDCPNLFIVSKSTHTFV